MRGTPRGSSNTRTRQRRAVERRRSGPQQPDVVPGLRRELRPHGPVHVPARRHVRRVQGGGVPERHPAHVLVERLYAVHRERRQRPDGDLSTGGPSDQSTDRRLEQLQAGLRAARRGRLRRVAEEHPVVLPRRRQPGHLQRHAGRLRRQRHEPGQRLHRSRDPAAIQDEQLGCRGRIPDGKATFALRWDYSKFENDNPTLQWTNPFFGPSSPQQPVRHDLPRTEQHVQQVHGLGQLPRHAVALGDLGALHVGEDDERLSARADRAQLRRRL